MVEQATQWQTQDVGRYYDKGGADWFAAITGDNSHVGYWPEGGGGASLPEAADNLTDLLCGKLRVGPGDRVLDLGCGVGRPAVRVSRATGAEVTGVAISAEQIRRAEELAEREGVADRVRFRTADALDLPFEDGSFDAVLALESVMHMTDRGAVFAEAARVLRPGGVLALTDMFEREPVTAERRAAVDGVLGMMFTDLADLADYPRMLRAAGLRLAELRDITAGSWTRTQVETKALFDARREEMAERLGPRFTERSDAMMAGVLGLTEAGYAVVVAELPAAAGA